MTYHTYLTSGRELLYTPSIERVVGWTIRKTHRLFIPKTFHHFLITSCLCKKIPDPSRISVPQVMESLVGAGNEAKWHPQPLQRCNNDITHLQSYYDTGWSHIEWGEGREPNVPSLNPILQQQFWLVNICKCVSLQYTQIVATSKLYIVHEKYITYCILETPHETRSVWLLELTFFNIVPFGIKFGLKWYKNTWHG